jgi:NDP-sugar pyrophosphorylase family protein
MIDRAKSGIDGIIIGVQVEMADRFGQLSLDPDGLLTGFCEKATHRSPSVVNGGIYLLRSCLLPTAVPAEPKSLERDSFPAWLRQGKQILVLQNSDPFIDIGTPESLAQAADFLSRPGEKAQNS